MDAKLLTELGWKTLAVKNKVKDNGLQKALATYGNLDEEKYADRIKAVALVAKLAGDLKKAKEVTALGDVVKYLTNIMAAATEAQRDLTQQKALAEKSAAAAAKKEAEEKKKAEQEADEEEEDETGDSFVKLTNALKLLKTAKAPYYFLLCDAKPFGLVISKKDITKSSPHKQELAKIAGGSTRPPKFGTVKFENGKYVFDMEKPPSGLPRIFQKWIKDCTGLAVKMMVGTETAEDEAEESESVPDAPPTAPKGDLSGAADVWHETRETMAKGIDQLKTVIRKEFAGEAANVMKEIENNLKKLDGVMDKLDRRLADSITKAHSAKDDAARAAELKTAKTTLAEYLQYVKNEPLLAHIDSNPFGVKLGFKGLLTEKLTHLANAVS